jgi:hypothetical protein
MVIWVFLLLKILLMNFFLKTVELNSYLFSICEIIGELHNA